MESNFGWVEFLLVASTPIFIWIFFYRELRDEIKGAIKELFAMVDRIVPIPTPQAKPLSPGAQMAQVCPTCKSNENWVFNANDGTVSCDCEARKHKAYMEGLAERSKFFQDKLEASKASYERILAQMNERQEHPITKVEPPNLHTIVRPRPYHEEILLKALLQQGEHEGAIRVRNAREKLMKSIQDIRDKQDGKEKGNRAPEQYA